MAISQSQATGPFSQHGSNFVVLDARRSQKQVRNNSRPKDTSMQAKAVKGLSDAVILARGGYATKATALGGTGKVADRHSHTVQDGYSGIVEQPFVPNQTPQTLFERPPIGCLSHETAAMKLAQGREKVSIMPTEVLVESPILADQEVGFDHFHRDHLALSKLRSVSVASQSLSLHDRWQGVIDQTKTCDHAIIQAHDVPPQPFRFCLAEDSRPHGPFLLQDQLAHRVS